MHHPSGLSRPFTCPRWELTSGALVGWLCMSGGRAGQPSQRRMRVRVAIAWVWLAGMFGILAGVSGAVEIETEAPLPAEEAAATMSVPPGFQVSLFAAEPDVRQPIGFCIDDLGRLWVAEAYNYPHHGTEPGDRIVILEDSDGDGRADKRTVFYEGLNYVTGIEVGFGGAWVMSPPYFYFIPDADGDDVPDSEPKLLLDGFGNHANSHNLANALAWGPDGWLYGTHGRTNWSKIGKPGTPEEQRQVFDGGVYRYHPTRHVWESFADGTTNPWGIDWDDYGQGFVCNCVTPHLYHVIQGGHYEPWRNRESSRYAYERLATIADHLHYVGTQNVRDGLGSDAEDHAGGGHAHCGTMIYLGDNWPDQYRNQVFMHNIHGKRINQDDLRRSGSGYVASHAPDLMRSADPWFMGVTLQYGPDGAVYSSDWSDTGECHSVRNTRRETGRIFKISYGDPRRELIELDRLSHEELVGLHSHRNDWYVRHARRILQERAAAGADLSAAHRRLREGFAEQEEIPRKLRALWTLHATGGADANFLAAQLVHPDEDVRGWAIRLLCERPERLLPAMHRTLARLAREDDSPRVRLELTSALQRLRPASRWPIVTPLAERVEDAEDANLPLMIWYAIEPLYDHDLAKFVELAGRARIPLVRRLIARRVAEGAKPESYEAILRGLADADAGVQVDLIEGLLDGFEGRRTVAMPTAWGDVYAGLRATPEVRGLATRLALLFDDPAALVSLRELAMDEGAAQEEREMAVRTLVARKPDGLALSLLSWLDEPAIRGTAIRGLAEYDHPETAERLLAGYPHWEATHRQDALQTLAARRPWAVRMLDAVEAGDIPLSELTAFTARQLENLGDPVIRDRVVLLWGQVRPTPKDKADSIARYKKAITADKLAVADRAAGRVLFESRCGNCHRLFGQGAELGPDLTGSQRTELDYVLENLIDPSAVVAKDYQMQVILTYSGRVITGLLVARTDQAITIQTTNDRVVVPVDEIESHEVSPLSVMPEGLLEQLSTRQVIELIAYLAGPGQVALPGE